jgi:hypothetical protein
MVTLTAGDLTTLRAGGSVTKTSTSANGHMHMYMIACAGTTM